MVFAVQCPNAKCHKYMLVEEHDRNKIVACLLCKTPIKVGSTPPPPKRNTRLPPPGLPSLGRSAEPSLGPPAVPPRLGSLVTFPPLKSVSAYRDSLKNGAITFASPAWL